MRCMGMPVIAELVEGFVLWHTAVVPLLVKLAAKRLTTSHEHLHVEV